MKYWFEVVEFFFFFALAFGSGKVTSWLWSKILPVLTSRTRTNLDDHLVKRTRGPIGGLIYRFVLQLAWVDLHAPLAEVGWEAVYRWGNAALWVFWVVGIAALVNGAFQAVTDWYLEEVAQRTQFTLDEEILPIAQKLGYAVIFVVALIVVLEHFNIKTTGIAATAGVASLGFAFAAQETLSNMIAGVIIMTDRPFKKGDRIEFTDGRIGDVVEVGLRSTRVRTFDNNILVVPNKEMVTSRIINWNYPDVRAAARINFGVAYGSDVEKVKSIVLAIMTEHPLVLPEPAPSVWFTKFADSSLEFLAICHVGHYTSRFVVIDYVHTEIHRRFGQEGIEIPFPQRVVHTRQD